MFKGDQIYKERRKSRNQECRWQDEFAILNSEVKVGCTQMVIFQKRLEGGEVDMLQRSTTGRGAASTRGWCRVRKSDRGRDVVIQGMKNLPGQAIVRTVAYNVKSGAFEQVK